jgi:hypothetical protein
MSKSKAPKTCNSVDFQKAKKLKEKHERREFSLNRREQKINKQKDVINEAKSELDNREKTLNI